MIKKTITAFLAALMLLSLTACGEVAPAQSSAAPAEVIAPAEAAEPDPEDVEGGYVWDGEALYVRDGYRGYSVQTMYCLGSDGLVSAVKQRYVLSRDCVRADLLSVIGEDAMGELRPVGDDLLYCDWPQSAVDDLFSGMDSDATLEYIAQRYDASGATGTTEMDMYGPVYDANGVKVSLEGIFVVPRVGATIALRVQNDTEKDVRAAVTACELDGCLLPVELKEETVSAGTSQLLNFFTDAEADAAFRSLPLETAGTARLNLTVIDADGATSLVTEPIAAQGAAGVEVPQGELLLERDGARLTKLSFDEDAGVALLCLEKLEGASFKYAQLTAVYDGLRGFPRSYRLDRAGDFTLIRLSPALGCESYGLERAEGVECYLSLAVGGRTVDCDAVTLGKPAVSEAAIDGARETFRNDSLAVSYLGGAATAQADGTANAALALEVENLTDKTLTLFPASSYIETEGRRYDVSVSYNTCPPHSRSIVLLAADGCDLTAANAGDIGFKAYELVNGYHVYLSSTGPCIPQE